MSWWNDPFHAFKRRFNYVDWRQKGANIIFIPSIWDIAHPLDWRKVKAKLVPLILKSNFTVEDTHKGFQKVQRASRMGLSKSGYLPKRIRRIRRSK